MIFNFGRILRALDVVSGREPPVEQAAGRLRPAEVAVDGLRVNHRIGGYALQERGVDCILRSYSAQVNGPIAHMLLYVGGTRATMDAIVASTAQYV
jgi:hypothetical protein